MNTPINKLHINNEQIKFVCRDLQVTLDNNNTQNCYNSIFNFFKMNPLPKFELNMDDLGKKTDMAYLSMLRKENIMCD